MSGTAPRGGPGLPQRRVLRTELPGPRSRELLDRKTAAVAAGVGMSLPVFVRAAGGGVVVDADDNMLIDLGSGIAVTTVGNAAPEVVEAVTEQVARFTHTCFMITGYQGYVEVAELLNRITPGDHPKTTALFNSGAEAVENAIKIARRSTGRSAVVAFDHAYHGRTNLTMALTAKLRPYKDGFGPFAPEVYRAPVSYPLRDGLSGAEAAARAIAMIEKQVGAEHLAAVIIEPILGEGGFIVPAPGFLPALADWAARHGVVFVADEIQTGFARTGDLFACEHEGVVPDLVTTAKGIAGGLPLAAVTGRAEIMNAVPAGGLGGTYGGNPLACAAALAALRIYRERDLPARAREVQRIITGELAGLTDRPDVAELRGRGAMMALELVRSDTGEPDPERTQEVLSAVHRQGVILLTCGTDGNVIRLLPPLSIPDDLLREGLRVLRDAVVTG